MFKIKYTEEAKVHMCLSKSWYLTTGRYESFHEEQKLCDVRDEFIFISLLFVQGMKNDLFEKIQFKKYWFLWLFEADMLSWLFNMEIFVLMRFIRGGWELQ